jgi:molybdenum cofactor cytidylyltransferase
VSAGRRIAAIVLAAGGSERFGSPKALATFRGSTLLARAIDAASGAGSEPVFVVVGGGGARVEEEARARGVRVVPNPAWSRGPGTSVQVGVVAARHAAPGAAGFLFLACDQPLLTEGVVRSLAGAFDGSPGRVVACAYAGTVGIPALFEASLAGELASLPPERGAKELLVRHADRLVRVPWEDGARDVDRPEDLARILHEGPG